MDVVVASLDAIIVVLTAIACWISIRLTITTSRGGVKWGWWSILPLVIGYALVLRAIVLLCVLSIINPDIESQATSYMVIFWAGLTVFLYGMCEVTKKIISKNCK